MFLFVAPARMRVRAQAAWAMALLACASKFACYKAFGGDAFAPELPEKLIWTWNWVYSGMCLLLAMAFFWRIVRWILQVGPPRGCWKAVWLVGLPVVAWGTAAVGVWNGIKVPEVREVVVEFTNLPESLDGYRILHMTDLHASSAARRWRTEAIVERANAADADLVCLTGDYADGMSYRQARSLEPLKDLKAKDGILAVTGNHEYDYGMDALRKYRAIKVVSWRVNFGWKLRCRSDRCNCRFRRFTGGKSRNLQAADIEKGAARCAAVLCGISLTRITGKVFGCCVICGKLQKNKGGFYCGTYHGKICF